MSCGKPAWLSQLIVFTGIIDKFESFSPIQLNQCPAEEQMEKHYSLQAGDYGLNADIRIGILVTLTSLHPGCMHLTQVEPGKKRKRVAALYAIGWQETLVLVWLKYQGDWIFHWSGWVSQGPRRDNIDFQIINCTALSVKILDNVPYVRLTRIFPSGLVQLIIWKSIAQQKHYNLIDS